MEIENENSDKIMKTLLKEYNLNHTISSLAEKLNLSRVGVWKLLKKMERDKFILLERIGKGKTSTYTISLNWNNYLTEKKLIFILSKEAINQERWMFNFSELENHLSFLLLFGSILNNPKDAKDIDIIAVLDDKENFKKIEEKITKIQISQIKKVHCIDMIVNEFEKELNVKNKAYIEAISKGIVLFGQEQFVKFIKKIQTK